MSEFQCYEFVAIDEPLTATQMAELRARSSRAVITPTSFVNECHWGNLKGDPTDWMRRYFDAHIYVANWYSCWLLLRVPKDAFDVKTLNAFATQPSFTVERTDRHWILSWELSEGQDDDRFGAEDGRGWMGRLAALRDELLRGDLRPLYLGWLAGVSAGEIDDAAVEPSPPPGLSRLTAVQRSLVEFLEIDGDLLAAAAAKRQAARESYLRTLADDFDRCWKAAHERAERGTAAAYDDVQRALADLVDAYTLCASRAEFEQRLPQFMAKHSKRGALVRRLVESGLWKNKP